MSPKLLIAPMLLSIVFLASGQSPLPSSAATPTQPSAGRSASTVQVKTRLVTVDVVAEDSHGNVIRGLTADDFEISDGGRQKIERFAFVDKSNKGPGTSATKASGAAQPPRGFYSNQADIQNLTTPPTVVLMDSLNSDISKLARTRHDMLALLKTLPQDAPVAVFLLGDSLHVVQSFTSNPELLRAAVDKAISPSTPADLNPEDDPDSLSLAAFDADDGQENLDTRQLEDFEKENYAQTMDVRVQTTTDALVTIARYLAGYAGRKNLLWVSESFPLALIPDPNFGTSQGIFRGMRNYADQAAQASEALSDAQVAVYPVDVRGLDVNQTMTASQRPVGRAGPAAARSLPAALGREDSARIQTQQTMDAFAEDSGGKSCKNTNDLSGCVETALKDSSSYYELAYEPQNVEWNGSFRKISLKTTHSGARLSYRRGYFATDAETLAAKQTPEKRLQQACQDFLPSTAIPLMARAVAPSDATNFDFDLSIPSGNLAVISDGQSHKLNAQLATCAYKIKGGAFSFSLRDLSQTLSDSGYALLQSRGMTGRFSVGRVGINRVRLAVLDVTSGEIGALDIPIDASAPPVSSASSAGATPPSGNSSAAAGARAASAQTSIAFRVASGQSGKLDWGGTALVYQGDLGLAQTAPAFFNTLFGKDFSCRAGSLSPNDPAGHDPSLRITFISDASGNSAVVDLSGDQPEYSGTLPVDDSAKPFFTRLWFLVHCRQAP